MLTLSSTVLFRYTESPRAKVFKVIPEFFLDESELEPEALDGKCIALEITWGLVLSRGLKLEFKLLFLGLNKRNVPWIV